MSLGWWDRGGTIKFPKGGSMQCTIVNCCKNQQERRRKLLLIYVTDVMMFPYDALPCLHTLYKSEQTVVLLGYATKLLIGNVTLCRKIQRILICWTSCWGVVQHHRCFSLMLHNTRPFVVPDGWNWVKFVALQKQRCDALNLKWIHVVWSRHNLSMRLHAHRLPHPPSH